jgi:hypothetical protein
MGRISADPDSIPSKVGKKTEQRQNPQKSHSLFKGCRGMKGVAADNESEAFRFLFRLVPKHRVEPGTATAVPSPIKDVRQ